MFISRDILDMLKKQFDRSRKDHERGIWFVYTIIAIIIPSKDVGLVCRGPDTFSSAENQILWYPAQIGSAETQTRHPNAVANHLHFYMMATSVAWIYTSRLERTPSRRHLFIRRLNRQALNSISYLWMLKIFLNPSRQLLQFSQKDFLVSPFNQALHKRLSLFAVLFPALVSMYGNFPPDGRAFLSRLPLCLFEERPCTICKRWFHELQ